ncbi:MAG: L,D-transpeptidase family protein [bacterium]
MTRKLAILLLIVLLMGALGGAYYLYQNRKADQENLDRFHMAKALLESKDYDRAIKQMLPVVQYGRSFSQADAALFLLAEAYEGAGHDEAKDLLIRLAQEFPRSPYALEAQLKLARTLEKNSPAQARETYDKLEKQGPPVVRGKARVGIARTYELENNIPKAREMYYQIIQSATDFEVVAEAKDQLSKINTDLLWSPVLDEFSQLYTIEKGDAAVSIGQKFKTTAWFVTEANKIKANNLRPGRRIKVPKEPFWIVVNKLRCRLDLLTESGRFIKWYPVGVGEQSYKTPANEYKIINKEINPTWYRPDGGVLPAGHPDNALGSRWMGIGSSLGIHGTNAPDTIGKPKSAGCIRMHNADVEELYKLVTYGTRVTILEGTEPVQPHVPETPQTGAAQG